jgi:hypothetical protein
MTWLSVGAFAWASRGFYVRGSLFWIVAALSAAFCLGTAALTVIEARALYADIVADHIAISDGRVPTRHQATALLEEHREFLLRATSSWPAVVNFAAWIVGVAMLALFLITK